MTPEPRHDRNGWQAHQWNIWQTSASLFVYKATLSEKLQQRQRVRNIVLGMCGKNREDKQKLPEFCENKKNLEAFVFLLEMFPFVFLEKSSLDILWNISTEEIKSYRFWMIWGWKNNDRTLIFQWTFPFKLNGSGAKGLHPCWAHKDFLDVSQSIITGVSVQIHPCQGAYAEGSIGWAKSLTWLWNSGGCMRTA